jgi:hypothetical protein
MIVTMFLVRLGKIVSGLLPVRLKKIPVRMSPTDNVFTVLKRHLFAAFGQKP